MLGCFIALADEVKVLDESQQVHVVTGFCLDKEIDGSPEEESPVEATKVEETKEEMEESLLPIKKKLLSFKKLKANVTAAKENAGYWCSEKMNSAVGNVGKCIIKAHIRCSKSMRKAKRMAVKLIDKVSKAKSEIVSAMKPEDKTVVASAPEVPVDSDTAPRHLKNGIVLAQYLEEISTHLERWIADDLVVSSMSFGIHQMSAVVKERETGRLEKISANIYKRFPEITIKLVEHVRKQKID